MWGAGHFALRSMEKLDFKTLKVQFYWERKLLNGVTEIKLLTEPKSTPVVSGDTFTLTTPDPDRLPLPSWSLLEIQWHLQRIVATSGTAEAQDYPDSDDDFDDIEECLM
ncbi:hypothetical protein TSTA_035530 [Talaromyces stipitatus ATCC 10500]|uniref:Uncharacterized protein n=1 Tax=Talaromyces stipitatus (strain ATCC 10500 / CBS 375.48 / QM 6759 / NRRL 1006) TaxID=441959 RepID=B8M7A7_TALSN|nr:uncharacterized protein TSTA_035530 [Talaromyces stipitatus ATCC 10500]EED20327.1 hypothetical protein TSTA_035530 [Talaromyces stipitatus ATCC 10500]